MREHRIVAIFTAAVLMVARLVLDQSGHELLAGRDAVRPTGVEAMGSDGVVTEEIGQPLIIEKGKVYVLEYEGLLDEESAKLLSDMWERSVGAMPIILSGGIKVARGGSIWPPTIAQQADYAACLAEEAAAEEAEAYPLYWRLRVKLPDRHGQPCRIIARGRMNSVCVEFMDGYQVTTSRWAVRMRA
jgi:hypothetical protein